MGLSNHQLPMTRLVTLFMILQTGLIEVVPVLRSVLSPAINGSPYLGPYFLERELLDKVWRDPEAI